MADDPGVRRQALVRRVKTNITTEDATARKEQAEALTLQGQMLRDSSLARLGYCRQQAWLRGHDNSTTDTLPHNSNLAKWYGGLHLGICKLCGHKQTLLYNVEVSLQLRRYNRRHNQVLVVITAMANSHLLDTYRLTADLSDTYNFPSHITPTNLRPDLVLWSDMKKRLYIVELTICFETSFDEAADRKRRHYADLVEDARRQGYHTQILPIQVGSRGIIDDSLEGLRDCLKPIPLRP